MLFSMHIWIIILFQQTQNHRCVVFFFLQGIEKLKREDPTWEKTPSWEAIKSAFGGPLSVAWLSPFSDLSCQKDASAPVPMFPQGEIIEEDVIEIPLEPSSM